VTTSAQPLNQPTGTACSEKGIHREVIRTVKAKLPDMIHLFDLAEFFKIFGDSTRLQRKWNSPGSHPHRKGKVTRHGTSF
jgi:ArsR family transcriptional regulator